MEIERKLKLLTEYGLKAAAEALPAESYFDRIEQISAERIDPWRQLLSSIISAESAEEHFIGPVVGSFADQPLISEYLKTHQDDENRHHRVLFDYVKLVFQFERTHRSFAKKVIYGRLLPKVADLTGSRYPLSALAFIYFYEIFSRYVYNEVKTLAERDQLSGLTKLIEVIEKDERRHLAGIETIFEYYQKNIRPLGIQDVLVTRSILSIARLDLTQKPWAIHNRQMRERLITLGISPERWEECGKNAVDVCMGLFRGEYRQGTIV